jgi:hypothetical protein
MARGPRGAAAHVRGPWTPPGFRVREHSVESQDFSRHFYSHTLLVKLHVLRGRPYSELSALYTTGRSCHT